MSQNHEKGEKEVEDGDEREVHKEEFSTTQGYSFDEKMQDLGVQEKQIVIKWRSFFSIFMPIFLSVQYIVIISLLILQGFSVHSFQLDNYIFYILIFGTLVQSYFLIQIIFKYMFNYKK